MNLWPPNHRLQGPRLHFDARQRCRADTKHAHTVARAAARLSEGGDDRPVVRAHLEHAAVDEDHELEPAAVPTQVQRIGAKRALAVWDRRARGALGGSAARGAVDEERAPVWVVANPRAFGEA
eukprot:4891541-Prymnesium_polylepis.1